MTVSYRKPYLYLQTEHSCYVVKADDKGVEHIYYGAKIDERDAPSISVQQRVPLVNSLNYADDKKYSFDDRAYEYSFAYRGDSRVSAARFVCKERSVFDFKTEEIQIDVPLPKTEMPLPDGEDGSLCITLKDGNTGVIVKLWYAVYTKSDVIARFTQVFNEGETEIVVQALASLQLDMPNEPVTAHFFGGAWGREFTRRTVEIKDVSVRVGSRNGMSSAECNPFFQIEGDNAVYAFHLMYSGSHEISIERGHMGWLRIVSGFQSDGLALKLKTGECLSSPCAVFTFADDADSAAANMSDFIIGHVIPKAQIPVMLNTWEATYFDLNEERLRKLADLAEKTGFECIVIDDGWFAKRRDDTSSLGDWFENKSIFQQGIAAFSQYVKRRGMSLGIWIEPEMISRDSDTYRRHSEWALRVKGVRQIEGRNQYLMDLTNVEVQNYIYDRLRYLVEDLGVSYIKWDFNRRFADVIGDEGSGYFYRYYRGLYSVLEKFRLAYPDVITENCASGGGRFDLGMMRYCPVSWPSDNTDPLSRAEIQSGALYGYPAETILAHVAASPSHQTHRVSALRTRTATATICSFGVQADIAAMTQSERLELRDAITEYKKIRGKLTRIRHLQHGENYVVLQSMSEDGAFGLLYVFQKRLYTSYRIPRIKLAGLDAKALYSIRSEAFEVRLRGSTLMRAGLTLPQNYHGDKMEQGMIMLEDNDAVLFEINKIGDDL